MDVLFGIHPVEEALRSGTRRFDHVCVARERHDHRLGEVVELARAAGVAVRTEPREALTRLAGTTAHQGVVAVVGERAFLDVEDLLEGTEPRLVLALDGVEDPQNLGALLRTAEGAGVDGVLLTERRSAPLSAVAVKASAGAAEHLRLARVVNLVRALETLKAAQPVGGGSGRARHHGLRPLRFPVQHSSCAGARGSGIARAGAEDVRPPAAHSHGGQGGFAQRSGGGRGGVI